MHTLKFLDVDQGHKKKSKFRIKAGRNGIHSLQLETGTISLLICNMFHSGP